VVAGAGLAGLSAARDLEAAGATVTLFEARDRVGGRVHTIRDGFARGAHAEGGADLIEAEQTLVHELAKALKLKTVRILRRGFGYYGPDGRGRYRIRYGPAAFRDADRRLQAEVEEHRRAERRWDSGVALALGRQSVADWLARAKADLPLRAGLRAFRGFFLADPEDLSLLALVDQFAAEGTPGQGRIYRLRDGNDALPRAMARSVRGQIRLRTVVRRIVQAARGVRVTVEAAGRAEIDADYAVVAIPATTLRHVEFQPRLPDEQSRAIGTLRYGHATRMLLQFARPFWRSRLRPSAYGSDLPLGAVWEGAEQLPGASILSLLAGGRASAELQGILARETAAGVAKRLEWLGPVEKPIAARTIVWENDEWARGGYAYFDPTFDPRLRAWLGRPAGRILFAGEHTSLKWQGYMNGAIESGRRAAAEVRALVRWREAEGAQLEAPPKSQSYADEPPEVWGS
jgi:monoamine oxidase